MIEPPPQLRAALEQELAGVPAARLRAVARELSERYRDGAEAAEPILGSRGGPRRGGAQERVRAYAAYRMPATWAAARAASAAFVAVAADFQPRNLLDVGGGTGAATWAAASVWPSLAEATVWEQLPEVIDLGRRLGRSAPWEAVRQADWTRVSLDAEPAFPESDLVTMGYVLGELGAAERAATVARATERAQAVLLVEPGTPAGYQRVIEARTQLIEAGFGIVAPCPHDRACPMAPGADWCHFAARVNRSALHRRLKDAELGHEDEKFSYVAAWRGFSGPRARNRVLRHPRQRKGMVSLTLCTPHESVDEVVVAKRHRELYRDARRVNWGDPWPPLATDEQNEQADQADQAAEQDEQADGRADTPPAARPAEWPDVQPGSQGDAE